MSDKEDGGPAFPGGSVIAENYNMLSDGMSLRDWFAGMVLQGMSPPKEYQSTNPSIEQMAQRAYLYADAMLAARKGDRP